MPLGFIATSVCSLSVDPATLLVCVNKSASSHDVILRTKRFSVNLLSASQKEIANRFTSFRGAERFEPGLWEEGETGCPRLINAAVAFDCDVVAVHDGFSHSIIVGLVADASVNLPSAESCLLWHNRTFAHSVLSAA
ncbi:flavin reductase [Burkholderia sp. OK233]|nr:flavin reductase [Burkholderia sp. OK233]